MRTLVGGETFGGRFDIVAEAGRGGMGKVFEATDRSTGARVAVKVVTAGADTERFQLEAEVLEQLAHPAIVRYVCHGITGEGHPYLAMEWLSGESLSTRLKRGALPIADVVAIGERIASALAHAHGKAVVHRDLKPSNVYLRDGAVDRATLIDFGVAKTEDKNLTTTGQMVGTPGYMAPEQVRGERGIDQRVDVFALGCVLYEAIAGTAPFDGGEVMEVLSRLLLEKPAKLPPEVPPRLVHLLDAMLVKDARWRLDSCELVREELATIAAALTGGDRDTLSKRSSKIPVPPPDTPTRGAPSFSLPTGGPATVRESPTAKRVEKSRTGLWIAIGVVGAVLGSVIGAYVVLRSTEPPAPPAPPTPPIDRKEVVAPVPPEPVCKEDDRTGCGTACDKGSAKACSLHAEVLLAGDREKHRKRAITAFRRACDLGELPACTSAADLLLDNRANVDEMQQALDLVSKACTEKGDTTACYFYAEQLRTGGAWENVTSAYALYGEACKTDGDAHGCDMLHEMVFLVEEGTPAQRKAAGVILAARCKAGVKEACR